MANKKDNSLWSHEQSILTLKGAVFFIRQKLIIDDSHAIVKTWLDENKLTLNVKKTKSMLIGNKNLLNEADQLDVRLVMDIIEYVGEFKYIWVWLDSSLKCTCHISKMSSKIYSDIGVISRVSRYLPLVQRYIMLWFFPTLTNAP